MTDVVAIIGDIHGEVDKLQRLLQLVTPLADDLVFTGDYVNRGGSSAAVLDLLIDLHRRKRCTYLVGNHDKAFLSALISDGFDRFLQLGGAATIRSYLEHALPDVERQFRAAVPDSHVDFLQHLTDAYNTDELIVQHEPVPHSEAKFGVFGHTPQRSMRPAITDARAFIDTGCGTWSNGRLTCLFWPSCDWVQHDAGV